MKSYPSISKEIKYGLFVYAFGKLDGSNIRAEWSKKKGLYKFGSRSRLLGSDQPIITKAETMICDLFSNDIKAISIEQCWERAVFFFEFFGKNSFAGTHEINDNHEVSLIDVAPHKHGLLSPKEFYKLFQNINIAPLLYKGICNSNFVAAVRNSMLQNMPEEGVVCKANSNKPIMFKIKSKLWIEKLRANCKDDVKKFNILL